MDVSVIGAGVIGSCLAHVLCRNGHDVSLLARGGRLAELERRGLVIRHYLQRMTTVDRPRIVSSPGASARYDAVFAVMQYQQMWDVLDILSTVDAPLVVLVGNTLSAAEMARCIQSRSPAPKKVLFGSSGTGGRRKPCLTKPRLFAILSFGMKPHTGPEGPVPLRSRHFAGTCPAQEPGPVPEGTPFFGVPSFIFSEEVVP